MPEITTLYKVRDVADVDLGFTGWLRAVFTGKGRVEVRAGDGWLGVGKPTSSGQQLWGGLTHIYRGEVTDER